jgi:hypothetical protein
MLYKQTPLPALRMSKVVMAFLAVLTFAGCSPSIQVYSDYDRSFDLTSYTTFSWGEPVKIESGNNPLYYNELNDKRIKSAVEEQLLSKGYARSNGATDLTIHYHILVEDESLVPSRAFGDNYGSYWMRMQTDVYHYRKGTLIIDLMEPKTNSLVWRGWATAAIDIEYDSKEIDKLVKESVKEIFKSFPSKGIPSKKN